MQSAIASSTAPDLSGCGSATLHPLSPVFGAEIRGLQVAAGVGDEQMRFVRDSVHRYSLIVLRDQQMSPQQQVEFSKRFGPPLRVSIFAGVNPPGVRELTIVSNIVREGKPVGVRDAGALWHTDGSYLARPDLYTALHALEVPHRDGRALGDTAFASTAAAFDALPLDLKQRIEGRRAVHSLAHHMAMRKKANFRVPPVAPDSSNPDVDHPIVRTHPITGRKCIYVTEGHTKCVVGLSDDESHDLLQTLFAHLMRPEFHYRHNWRVNDLVVWDNCATQHLAITDYGDIPRMLYRAGMEGPVPV